MKCYLVNQRKSPANQHIGIAVQYDFGGNTKTLPPDSETLVEFDEAQLALSKHQGNGVTIRYEK